MKKKHAKTLELINKRPTSGSVKWGDVTALIESLGGEVESRGQGSGYAFKLKGGVWFVHKPHPGNDLDKGAVAGLRAFLENLGVKP